tara:strand:- start:3563 stop:4153 length:591 start_codon:yes stop_codon:yes gene_type:complete
MRLTGKRLFGVVTGVLTIISFSRVAVLFLEAVAEVRDERLHDAELLELCSSGQARGSLKMRTACIQAQSDRASPLLLKAVVRAVATAWREFATTCASPLGFASMVLFVLSSLVLPVVPWLRMVLYSWAGDDEDRDDHRDSDLEHHVVVLNGDHSWIPRGPSMRKRMARKLIGVKRSSMPVLHEPSELAYEAYAPQL